MDHIDEKILVILKKNGKASATEISKIVGLSIPAVSERIRKMEHNGIIEGYGAKISRRKTGYNVTAFIMVNLERSGEDDEFRQNVVGFQEVLECHHVVGAFDYLLKVLVKTPDDLEHFLMDKLNEIPTVASSQTFMCLSTLKEEWNVEIM
ncbi:MAG: Lrp/AsnC family transcriptional regulator [Caecibacter sp.]|jgi:Lrp/AsnC family leucine-responsive transcriptional regulator|nr:Lrp/AsnC family transcriptional regulator [Megasphaera sp.]MEE0721943.1 Lrp/AsnC family transcriptional regulator [Caecibacter sp.]